MRPQRYSRRELLGATAGISIAGLAGCLGDDSTDTETETDPSTGEQTGEDATQVGMIYALAGLDDRSFNDAANRGIQRARLDYGISFSNHEPDAAKDIERLQRELARSETPTYDLLCCIGFVQQDSLGQIASEYPEQQFMIVDATVDAENVASYVFKEHEGSFQSGHLAGELTSREITLGTGTTNPDERIVGFVGGVENDLIKRFEAGYRAGVKYADSEVTVRSSYVGNFADVQTAFDMAQGMYDDGADIVYHAAGGAGLGVFQAAQAANRYAIGVDADQSRSNPRYADVILASMVKRVDNAIYSATSNVVEGGFQGGSVVPLGLEADGVDVVYGTSLEPAIPNDVKTAIQTSREAIIAGDITVPTEVEG
ncbi:BMP family ABC transporter substrate-binding protein [Halorhabdus sp. CBA1104]|uniref:BMP family lipoprotein n=1 Tax=Halorhabdus sp. CBA1104 TaxID=1380432 RepID=UPI0012B1F10F|nr:BMP family protein [Halorhabdus sp. CBA1104]QGN06949.1 BMP family ABC transporter substrate-binding protein [Halorhabdus sp. CBA1104]